MNLAESFALVSAIIFTDIASNFIPSPNMLLIISHSLSDRKSGLGVLFGLVLANLLLFIGSFLFVGQISLIDPVFSVVLKYIFSGYLIYLGIRSLRSCFVFYDPTSREGRSNESLNSSRNLPDFVKEGLITCLVNPTASVYFLSLATLLTEKGVGVFFQIAVISGISISVVLCYGSCAMLCSWPPLMTRLKRIERYLSGFVGALFCFFGLMLVLG
jgi:threonine/homoserine/homoserine lactone efflux protein